MTIHYQCDTCGHRYGYDAHPAQNRIDGHRPGCVGGVRLIDVVSNDREDLGWAVVSPSGAVIATTEPGEPRAWAESYLARLTSGGAVGYAVVPRWNATHD